MVATKKVSGVSSLVKIPFIVHGLEESDRILFQSPERLTILEALTVDMFRGQQARQQLLCILFCPVEELSPVWCSSVSSSFRSSVCLTTSVTVKLS